MTFPSPISADALLEHVGFIRAMARGVLGDDDRIDDVTQDTFVAALSRERPPSRLGSWLASVARRRAADVRRRDAVRARHLWGVREVGASPATDDLVAGAEVSRRLVEAVLALEEPQREAVLLRYWEGLPPRDIAARLGAPVETVRTRIKRAHSRLRERLDAVHGGDRRAWAGALTSSLGIPTGAAPSGAAATAASVASRGPQLGLGIGIAAVALVCGIVLAVAAWRRGDAPPSPDGGGGGDVAKGPGGPPTLAASPADAGPPADPAPGPGARGGAPGGGAAPPANAPPEGLEVRGTVRDEGGAPVPHYPVRYSLTPASPKVAHPPPDESYTDAQGRYEIRGLLPGVLWMNVLPEVGFGTDHERNVTIPTSGTQDFVVTGTYVLEARVEGASGKRLEAWLDYRRETVGGGWGNVWAVRKVILPAGEATFRFTALQPGAYELQVQAQGATKHRQVLRIFGDRKDLVVRLGAAQRLTLRVTAKAPLDPEVTSVYLRSIESGAEDMLDRRADGTWAIEGRPDGRYLLLVRNLTEPESGAAEAFARSTERAREITLPFAGDLVEVEVVPDEEVGLVVRTADGQPVEGKVTVSGEGVWPDSTQGFRAEVDDGRALTTATDGFGLPGFPIRLQRADGALLLQGMLRGRYTIGVVAQGYAPAEREIVVAGPTTVDVTLSRDVRPTRLVRTEVEKARYWTVEARRVGDPSVGDVWKRVLWMDDRVRISHRPTPGVFEAALDVGEWEFRLASDRYAPASLGPTRVEASDEPLTLSFPLAPGAAVSGTLRDKAGRPVNLVLHVFRRAEDGAYRRLEEKTPDVDAGVFRIPGLAPGSYRIALSEDAEHVVADFTVTGATDQTLELSLPR